MALLEAVVFAGNWYGEGLESGYGSETVERQNPVA